MGQNSTVIKNEDAAGKSMDKRNGFLKKLIIILAVAIVVTFTVFYVIYYRFSYQADKLTKETARIYAFGDGEEMADKIAPGYVEKYESNSKVLSVSDIQGIYIDKFRAYVDQKIGDIDKIECKITGIQGVSNIGDLQQAFEENGVKGVSQYRSVDADWIVTDKDGNEVTVHIQEFVLKCDDGWYVDYVLFPEEISGIGSPEAVTEEQTSEGTVQSEDAGVTEDQK